MLQDLVDGGDVEVELLSKFLAGGAISLQFMDFGIEIGRNTNSFHFKMYFDKKNMVYSQFLYFSQNYGTVGKIVLFKK